MREPPETIELVLAGGTNPPPSPSQVQVEVGARSHQGKVRPNNEDHYLVAKFERSMQLLLTNLPEGEIPAPQAEAAYGMLVADGMGGHAAGEVASRAAIRFLIERVLSTPDWMMRLDDRGRKEVMRRTEQRLRQVADSLTQMAREDPRLFGMGTTMTLTCSLGCEMIIGHVGDSRAYLLREGQLKRLTRDHTVVQGLIDRGVIAPSEAATHPMRHLLLNAIGTQGNPVHAEVDPLQLSDGDQVLLCSDGLTDMISDAAITEILGQSQSVEEACQALIDSALEAGGKDNVTAVLGRYQFQPEREEMRTP
jgi:serine/threonine protein phosphatase PrpC